MWGSGSMTSSSAAAYTAFTQLQVISQTNLHARPLCLHRRLIVSCDATKTTKTCCVLVALRGRDHDPISAGAADESRLSVQFRAQPPGTPMAWEGRVEHVVSGQVTHVHTLAPWRSPPSSLPEGRCSRW
jgi:hypothetical protein